MFARPGDTLASIAARLMPDDAQAEQRLTSWNLHLVLRRNPVDSGRLLGTDIVYTEPPAP